MHTYVRTYIPTYIHRHTRCVFMHVCMQVYVHVSMFVCMSMFVCRINGAVMIQKCFAL